MADTLKWLFTTRQQAKDYATRVNQAIYALDRDVGENLVYADPVSLRTQADQWNAQADADEASGNALLLEQAKQERQVGSFWKVQADKLQKRADSRAHDQVNREITYSSDWNDFLKNWNEFYQRMQTSSDWDITPTFPGDLLEEGEAYDSTYRRYYATYQSMGYKPSSPLPPTPADVKKEHDTGGLAIPWTTLGIVAAVGLAGYAYLSRPRTTVVTGGGT